jgi:hypothetical protein
MTSDIVSVPYVRGIAEYACEVRRRVDELKGDDFVMAVDLPHGLEDTVLAAAKRLPRVSMVIDEVNRAIPILPTDAASEAIRSFLEYGYDIDFLDSGLPMTALKEYIENLLRVAADDKCIPEMGRETRGLLGAILDDVDPAPPRIFKHIAGKIGAENYARLFDPIGMKYMELRQRSMAARLKRLAGMGKKVLLVCSVDNWSGVMKYLESSSPAPEDALVMKTVTCRIREEDVWKISPEVPYVMYGYESRGPAFFDRKLHIAEIFAAGGLEPGAMEANRYAVRLAVAEGQMYPDVYDMAAASKYCVNDRYAIKVLEKAISYPLADKDSDCVLRPCLDMDLMPIRGQRTLVLDADSERTNNIAWLNRRRSRRPYKGGVYRFTRTAESQADELAFMGYLRNRFTNMERKGNFKPVEFTCGLRDGIDLRATLRYGLGKKLYVKERKRVNTAAYVVHFGGPATKSIFFDTHYYVVGAARSAGDHTEWCCFTAFIDKPPGFDSFVHRVDIHEPLIFCVELALSAAKKVFVFTDDREALEYFEGDRGRMKVFGLDMIPGHLLHNMGCYRVGK